MSVRIRGGDDQPSVSIPINAAAQSQVITLQWTDGLQRGLPRYRLPRYNYRLSVQTSLFRSAAFTTQWIKGFGDLYDGLELDALSVSTATLGLIAQYLEHCSPEQQPLRICRPLREAGDLKASCTNLDDWSLNFIESLDWERVFDLLKGADFMQIDALVDLAAARIASRMCGWSKDQKEAAFALPGGRELTVEEELALRIDYKWAEEEDLVNGKLVLR